MDLAAKHREELLYAKYAMGKETITKYQNEPPYGWIIPKDQRDPGVTELLLNKLVALDLVVSVAEAPFEADGILYPEGTYVLPTSQPFGRLLKTLFEIQVYPDLRKISFPLAEHCGPYRTQNPSPEDIRCAGLDTASSDGRQSRDDEFSGSSRA